MAKPNIGDLIPIGAIGTAKAPQVLSGYTFSSDAGVGLAGSMINRGTLNQSLTRQGQSVSISSGYYTGGTISTNISGLYASNIRQGVSVGGVVGSYNLRIKSVRVSISSTGTYTITTGLGDEAYITGSGTGAGVLSGSPAVKLIRGRPESTEDVFSNHSYIRAFGQFHNDGRVTVRVVNSSGSSSSVYAIVLSE